VVVLGSQLSLQMSLKGECVCVCKVCACVCERAYVLCGVYVLYVCVVCV